MAQLNNDLNALACLDAADLSVRGGHVHRNILLGGAKVIKRAIAVALVFTLQLLNVSASYTQTLDVADVYMWKSDKLTGLETAASRADISINYLHVGDRSSSGRDLIDDSISSIAHAAGITIDRSLKHAAIAIVHDTKVFDRLKSDPKSFAALGLPDIFISQLGKLAAEDPTTKCINISVNDNETNNNVLLTAILVSEEFDRCLIGGLLRAFGVDSLRMDLQSLTLLCALYEGRRRGLRTRGQLVPEISKLSANCVSKAGASK